MEFIKLEKMIAYILLGGKYIIEPNNLIYTIRTIKY